MQSYDVIIPARNEERTVAGVVIAAKQAAGVGEIIVVDDHSSDRTAEAARNAGAKVITSQGYRDKAKALATGVAASKAKIVVFFDADLRGVQPAHFDMLAQPLSEGYGMSCGLVDYGKKSKMYMRLPPITGMRALHRSTFQLIPHERLDRFNVELAINEVVARRKMKVAMRVLSGLRHRTKVIKRGWKRGVLEHVAMSAQLVSCWKPRSFRYHIRYLRNLDILPPTPRQRYVYARPQPQVVDE